MKKSFITLALLLLFSYGLKAQNFVEEVIESQAKISDKFKVKLEKLKKNDNFEVKKEMATVFKHLIS